MFQRRPGKFRRRPNGRNHRMHGGSSDKMRQISNQFLNSQPRNKYGPPLSAEKLLEKYTTLAKEAMTSGDKTLSENYLQHADHFMRIIEDKNKNRDQSKASIIDKSSWDDKSISKNSDIKQKDVTIKKE